MAGTALDRFDKVYSWVIFGVLSILSVAILIFLKGRIDKPSAVLLGLSFATALTRI